MKKLLSILVLSFLFIGSAYALPKCTGTYGSLLSFSWTNCYGKAEFKNGASYEGEFYNEKAHGSGIYIFANGDKVEGEFKNGVAHGWATMKLSNGNKYVGDFVDGLMSGKGTYFFSNGDIYEGEVFEGNIDGEGKYTFVNGEVYEGIFENGQFVKSVNLSEKENNLNSSSDEIIFKNCNLTPNYEEGTIVAVDIDKKIIKVTSPHNTVEYYDIKTIYGDLLVSSELKHGIGISENDLKQLKQVISTEFKIDLQSSIVSINWVINEGNSEMHKFFRDQLKSGRFKRNLSTKCLKY